MNPEFRKVALAAAVLGLIVALFVALRPDDDEGSTTTAALTTTAATTSAPTTTEAATTTTAATTTAPTTTAPTTTAPPKPPAVVRIQIAVSSTDPGLIRRFSVKKGRRVLLVVRADLSDHIHLHGYDLIADVAPGNPARIQFVADTAGRFEIELEDRGLQIADLEVRP